MASPLVDGEPIGRVLTLILLLGVGQRAQLRIRIGLERVSDESIGRIHLHVAVAGVVGFILGALDLPVAQTIGFVTQGAATPAWRQSGCSATASA